MTTNTLKILAAEDNRLEARQLSILMEELGHELVAITTNADDTVEQFQRHNADVLLIDIRLGGTVDGIELVGKLMEIRPTPVIFLTAMGDKATFERAKQVGAYAFLTKPYDALMLERSLELAVENFERLNPDQAGSVSSTKPSIGLRENNVIEKVLIEDIIKIEAEGAYCNIYTQQRKYAHRSSLAAMEASLPAGDFLRIHKSWLVRTSAIMSFRSSNNEVQVQDLWLPVGRTYREDVVNLFGTRG
jgi:DNA-binding LytR/AlgR family response regulator